MKKGIGKALEEFGKHLLNIGVAIIVFTIIQPIMHKEFDSHLFLLFSLAYVILVSVAVLLIRIGGDLE